MTYSIYLVAEYFSLLVSIKLLHLCFDFFYFMGGIILILFVLDSPFISCLIHINCMSRYLCIVSNYYISVPIVKETIVRNYCYHQLNSTLVVALNGQLCL